MFIRPNAEWTAPLPRKSDLDGMTASEATNALEAVLKRLGDAIGAFRDVVKYGQGSVLTELKLVRAPLKPPIVRLRMTANPRQLHRLIRLDPAFHKLPPQVTYD